MFEEAEKATNVHLDITFVGEETYDTMLPLLWAAGDSTDLMVAAEENYPGGIDASVEEEVLLDIAPYLEEYAPDYLALLESDETFRGEVTSDAGRIVSFYSYQEYADGGNVIRKDWLDDLGMEIPETMDELLEVLRAFKSEYDVKSPLLCNSQMDYLGTWAAYGVPEPSRFGDLTWFVKDGQVQCAQTAEEYRDALAWLAQCYEEKLLTDDFLNISEANDSLVNGETGFCWVTSYALDSTTTEKSVDPNYEVVAVPNQTLEAGGTTDIGGVTGGKSASSIAISADTAEPEICVSYLNYFYTEAGKLLTGFGVENEAFVYNEQGEKEFTELITNNPDGYPSFVAQSLYTGFVGTPMVLTKEARMAACTTESERESFDIWSSNRTDKLVYYGQLTTEENEAYWEVVQDLNTFAESERLKFVTGARSLDEFDDYVAEMESMGLNTALELKEQAYERYLESQTAE